VDPQLHVVASEEPVERPIHHAARVMEGLSRSLLIFSERRLDPEYALAHAVLAHAGSLLAREGLIAREVPEASIQRALQLSDDDPLIYHCQAAMHGNLGRTADGVRAWERSLALDPNSAAARAGLGIARIYMRQPDLALASIDQALRLSPRDPLTYHWLANRALACSLLGRWDEALEAAESSVQRTGTQVGYGVFAAALARAGRDEEAHAAYAELRRRTPELDATGIGKLFSSLSDDPARRDELTRAVHRAAGSDAPQNG